MTGLHVESPLRRYALIGDLRRDPLVRNSFFLMLTTALGAGSGFLFWLFTARLYPTAQVGQASSLLSTVALLSYFSLFGFSNALIRYLPTSRDRTQDTSTAISVVSVCSIAVSLVFAIVAPWLADDLGFVRSSPAHLVIFVILAVGAAINLLTDSIFVACRATKANLLINGVLMSVAKLALPALAVAWEAFGIFAASGIASLLAAAVSLVVIRRHLAIPVSVRVSRTALRGMLSYSLSSYLSGSLNLIPQIALPIIVLHQLGPVVAAVYFMAFQISNLVSAASYAIGESLFAEGSHEARSLAALARRSGALLLVVTGAAVTVVIPLARPILQLFGDDYARMGTTTLILFTASSLAVAFNTWTSFLLKVTRQLRALVLSNVVFLGAVLGIAVVQISDGLAWAAIAWGIGNLLSGVVSATALVLGNKWRPAEPQ
jgi:O-antigen/teichoic acid export membrane protein